MGISFRFLQCKRAHPPDIAPTATVEAKPYLYTSHMDYHIEVPVEPKYFDTVTQKHFTIPPTKEEDILKMLDFYGIDKTKIYQCPVCSLQANMRSLLPHLNNSTSDAGYYDTAIPSGIVMGVSRCIEYKSHGWDFKQLGKWMESLGY